MERRGKQNKRWVCYLNVWIIILETTYSWAKLKVQKIQLATGNSNLMNSNLSMSSNMDCLIFQWNPSSLDSLIQTLQVIKIIFLSMNIPLLKCSKSNSLAKFTPITTLAWEPISSIETFTNLSHRANKSLQKKWSIFYQIRILTILMRAKTKLNKAKKSLFHQGLSHMIKFLDMAAKLKTLSK